jgi:Putative quorum-sensing-regulated virulence factor
MTITLPFGRYAQQPLTEVPTSYLLWLTGRKFSRGLAEAVRSGAGPRLGHQFRVIGSGKKEGRGRSPRPVACFNSAAR